MKSGFVSILGKPNVGKSTLMNAILDQKLSIISRKPQTTRKKIVGIYNDDESQVVFLDTPGIVKPEYLLHKKMLEYVLSSIDESDLILFVVDYREYNLFSMNLNEKLIELLKKTEIPVLLVINKIDLLENRNEALNIINKMKEYDIFKEIVPLSAIDKDNVAELLKIVKNYLPEHPPYFDKDDISDAPVKFFISEIIREKIFESYHDEIPYSTEVVVEEYKERKNSKDYASISIIVERESQKGIIIGKNGEALKRIGEKARIDIEKFIDKGIYLQLFVKVKENWRDEEKTLKSFGY
jgi:GTP-binding protein Era